MKREGLLISLHEGRAVEIGEFAGWRAPIIYVGTRAEHKSVRNGCGIFDISHMKRTMIKGVDAHAQLSKILTADVGRLKPGKMKYCLILNEKGGIIDDVTVSRIAEEEFLMVSNASTSERVSKWMSKYLVGSVEVDDVTTTSVMFAVQGPRSPEVMCEIFGPRISELRWFRLFKTTYSGAETIVSRSGYTGEDGFEVVMLNAEFENAHSFWDTVLDRGATPCGLATRDILRLEAAYPLYGVDINEEMNPYEARLDWAVDLEEHDFVGKESLICERRIKVLLVGLRMLREGVPRRGMGVIADGLRVGQVTSGCLSYSLGKGIALSHLDPHFANEGTTVSIDYRGRLADAVVVLSPFVERRVPK